MKKLFILLLMLVCFSLTACDTVSNIKVEENPNEFEEEPIDEQYILRQAAEKIDVKSLAEENKDKYGDFLQKIQIFSAELTESVYKRSDNSKNLAISPVSVYMALAMTISNSSGVAKEELLNAVGVSENEVNDFTKFLYSTLKKEVYHTDDNSGEKILTSVLDLNNSIWIDQNISLKDSGLDNLANNFHADSFYVPFASNNGIANNQLSKYISNKTRGLIQPELQIAPETLFAIVNTLYLKDCWYLSSDLTFSKDTYGFTNSDGSVIQKNLLQTDYFSGRVYETEKYQHFYATTSAGYRLKFVVPNDGYNLSDVFTAETIYEINNVTDYNQFDEETEESHVTRVLFPAFEAGCNIDLIHILIEDFNVNAIFSEGYHMLGLTDEDVLITDIIHQSKLIVNEKGIEGAAVTVVVCGDTCAPVIVEHEFVVDKAFGYVLTDKDGNILFTGVVNVIE